MVFKLKETADGVATKLTRDRKEGDSKFNVEAFLKLKHRGGRASKETVPDGVLVDVHGQNELGERVLPEEAAEALFQLDNDGDLSKPIPVGDMWMLVVRMGVRPGSTLDEVPGDQRQAAREKSGAKRAMDLLEENIARLRKEHHVQVREPTIQRYAKSLSIDDISKFKPMRFSHRKTQLQRARALRERAPMQPAARDIQRIIRERKERAGNQPGRAPGANP
jgi:hypothetical protein